MHLSQAAMCPIPLSSLLAINRPRTAPAYLLSTMSTPKRHRIGYALAPKKVQSFIQPSLLSHAAAHSIDFVPIDVTSPLAHQGPLDCLIHKINGHDWNSQLEAFSSQNPNVPVIDPPAAIELLHNRVSMLEVAERVRVEVPRQVVVNSPDELDEAVRGGGLGFPILAKPVVADGSVTSHQMYLIFDAEGLECARGPAPVVLQEFVNHGGVIFKVYVAGRHVRCVRRRSLRDVAAEDLGSLRGAVPFSQVSNLRRGDDEADFEKVEMPPGRFVEEVASAMREEMGLRLFNFDVIRDARDRNRYLVIDINYFPGFAKLPDYESVLTEFFLDVLGRSEENAGLPDGELDAEVVK